MPRPTLRRRALLLALALPLCLAACWARIPGAQSGDEIVIHMPIRSAGPGSLDPVRGSTTYDNQASSLVYETLLQYKYLKRADGLELEPLLLTRMPTISEDGLTWSFELRDDVHFHDDECFVTDANPEGKGRKLVASDVIYSWKRVADASIDTKNWWLIENTIKGFDDWREERNLQRDIHERRRSKAWYKQLAKLYDLPREERPDDFRARVDRLFIDPAELRSEEWYTDLQKRFDVPKDRRDRGWESDLSDHLRSAPRDLDLDTTYDFYATDVPGMRVTGERTFEVELTEPVASFRYKLAMFQLSVLPREAVEHYGWRFSRHPVGTGPFLLEDWQTSLSMDFVRNPNYHEDRYPTEWDAEDEERNLHRDAGKLLPLADRIRVHCYVQDQPMWLDFKSGVLDYAQIPAENFEDAVNARTKTLTKEYAELDLTYIPVPLLDFIFRGFNCDEETSEILGGYSERAKNLRRAISLALDLEEFNDTFYNSQNIVYDGMIPPGLAGHPEGHKCDAAYRGPDLTEARRLLELAGYPNGEGLPTFDYYTSLAANSQEQSEMMRRQLAAIGIEINSILLEFPQLIAAIDERRAPIFSFAWGSDYPDGENNLALFYGPNASPGSNHYNYSNPEYDALYEQVRTMEPSPERTTLYATMRDMVLDDAAYVGSMARTRNYLGTPRLENFKPSEDFWNWTKYLTIDTDAGDEN
jgi:ABC-type transport system substrate-binding protein